MITDKEVLEAWDTIKDLLNYMFYESLEDLSMSQKQLADKTGISDSRISKYRRKIYSIEGATYQTIDCFVKSYAAEFYEMRRNANNLQVNSGDW